MTTSPEPFLRPYNAETDFEALAEANYPTWLELERFRHNLRCSPALHGKLQDVYYRWVFRVLYVKLHPELTVVLDNGTGKHVGHIVGVADTEKFLQEVREHSGTQLDPHLFFPLGSREYAALPSDLCLVLDNIYGKQRSYVASADVLAEYPAHLHIGIDAEYKGKGWGKKLMLEWERLVKDAGALGANLGMSEYAASARPFYLKVGYYPDPKDRLGWLELVKNFT